MPVSVSRRTDGLAGALWIGSLDPLAHTVAIERVVEHEHGSRTQLEVLGIQEMRVTLSDRELYRASDEELRHHLALLDLTEALQALLPRGGRAVLRIEARAPEGFRPAVIGRITTRERRRHHISVTGEPGWTLAGNGEASSIESSAQFQRPPLDPIPCLPLGDEAPRELQTADAGTEPGSVLFDLGGITTGYLDVVFPIGSRGRVRYAAAHEDLGSARAASESYASGADGVFRSFRRFTCRYVEVLPDAGAMAPVSLLARPTGAVSPRPVAAFSADDTALLSIDSAACEAAALAAQGFLEDGTAERTLQVASLRPAALTLYVAWGHYQTARRSLEILRDSRRQGGDVRAVYPFEGESPVEEPPEALAGYVIAVRDYVLHSGDLKYARKAWPDVDRQCKLLHQRTDASRLLLTRERSRAARRHALQANVMYAGALQAAADLARWIGRINAVRLRSEAETLRKAIGKSLLDPDAGLYVSWDRSGERLRNGGGQAPALRAFDYGGNALAALFSLSPGKERARLPILGAMRRLDRSNQHPFFWAAEAEAWLLEGRADEGLDVIKRTFGPLASGEAIPPAAAAAPAYLLRSLVLGVRPTSPGFETYSIEPRLGHLDHVEGAVGTPSGLIAVRVEVADGTMSIDVTAPPGLSGSLWPERLAKGRPRVTVNGSASAPKPGEPLKLEGGRAHRLEIRSEP